MSRLEVVRVSNPSKTQSLQLTSISGNASDFHPSFFKSKVGPQTASGVREAAWPGVVKQGGPLCGTDMACMLAWRMPAF